MPVGILTLEIHLPGCKTLKEKRSRIRPILHRLHREFNLSTAEMDHLDAHQRAAIACAGVCNDARVIHATFHQVLEWLDLHGGDVIIAESQIEIR